MPRAARSSWRPTPLDDEVELCTKSSVPAASSAVTLSSATTPAPTTVAPTASLSMGALAPPWSSAGDKHHRRRDPPRAYDRHRTPATGGAFVCMRGTHRDTVAGVDHQTLERAVALPRLEGSTASADVVVG